MMQRPVFKCVNDVILIQFPGQSCKSRMKCMWLHQTLYYKVLREFEILYQSLIIMCGKNRGIYSLVTTTFCEIDFIVLCNQNVQNTVSQFLVLFILTKENCFSFYKASLETFYILKKSFFKQCEG